MTEGSSGGGSPFLSGSAAAADRIKNKNAYVEAEEKLDGQITEGKAPAFAVTVLDVNDLKEINDTAGHQAGDRYLKDACMIICRTFKHSPVFRTGGDEFAVISQGEDYEHIDALVEAVAARNAEAGREGGVVIACGMAKYEGSGRVADVFNRADRRMYENKNLLKAAPPSA